MTSQNIRADPLLGSGRHGNIRKVVGSGMAIMSDSSIGLKPVMEEPSNPIPRLECVTKLRAALIEKAFS